MINSYSTPKPISQIINLIPTTMKIQYQIWVEIVNLISNSEIEVLCLKYFHNIFTTNPSGRLLRVFNLNPLLKLLFCPPQ